MEIYIERKTKTKKPERKTKWRFGWSRLSWVVPHLFHYLLMVPK